jgi:hypothetical protein
MKISGHKHGASSTGTTLPTNETPARLCGKTEAYLAGR